MNCPNCSYALQPTDVVCPQCGAKRLAPPISLPDGAYSPGPGNANDAPSFWLWILGFFIPLAGFIVWVCLRSTTPRKGASAGWGALIGLMVPIVLAVVFPIFAMMRHGNHPIQPTAFPLVVKPAVIH